MTAETTPLTALPSDAQLPWYQRRAAITALVSLTLFTDMLAYSSVVPLLPALGERFNISQANLGLVVGAYALGLLISTPPCAWISDRYRTRKWPMAVGLAGLAIGSILFTLAKETWHLIMARIFLGLAGGAPWSVGLSLLADVYPEEHLGAAMGFVFSFHHGGFMAGPILGGVLAQYASPEAPFYLVCALALFTLVVRLAVDDSHYMNGGSSKAADAEQSRPAAGERMSVWTMIKGKPVYAGLIVTFLIVTLMSGLEPTLPVHLKSEYDLSESNIGYVFVSLIVPSMFTSTLTGRLADRFGSGRVMVAGLLATAVCATPVGINKVPLGVHVLFLVLLGIAQGMAMTPALPAMGRHVSAQGSADFATVYGLFTTVISVAVMVGPIVSAGITQAAGFISMLGVFTGILGVLSFALWAHRADRIP